jgi:hypothetical protein
VTGTALLTPWLKTPLRFHLRKLLKSSFPAVSALVQASTLAFVFIKKKLTALLVAVRGTSKTDPRKLEKARVQRATKKQAAIASAQALNAATPIFDQVFAMASWNELSASLAEQHNSGRAWSEKQVLAISSMVARMEERRAQRAAEATSVDLRLIVSMFAHARDKGYKRPIYRAEGLKISLAPATGANAGALYVKTDEDQYIGKVVDQQFFASRDATDEHKTALSVIAQSPRDAAIRYGQKTGHCACCGRALSNRQSVDLGIGPICAGKWGFM